MIDWRHFNTLILYHLPILVISLNSSSASAPGGPPEPHPRSSGPRGLPRRPRARRGGPSRTAKCLELAASANYAPHQVGVGAPPVEARLPRAAHSAPRVGVKLEGHLRRRVLLLVRRREKPSRPPALPVHVLGGDACGAAAPSALRAGVAAALP